MWPVSKNAKKRTCFVAGALIGTGSDQRLSELVEFRGILVQLLQLIGGVLQHGAYHLSHERLSVGALLCVPMMLNGEDEAAKEKKAESVV